MGENSSSLVLSFLAGVAGVAGSDEPFFELCLLQKFPVCAAVFPVVGVVGDSRGFGASSIRDATGCASTAVAIILLKSIDIPVNPNTFSSSVVILPSVDLDDVVGARPESLFLSS
jgi:hypothetical protein